MSAPKQIGRTYNQNHIPRPYMASKRRFSIYWTWSYPWEANRDLTELDNRFSTMTEVRRVAWPAFEGSEWDKMNFLQGIAGTLELFHRSTLAFQQLVGETTGHPVAVYQRIDQAGYKLPIDERVLADTDTLMVFALDHQSRAGQTWLAERGDHLQLSFASSPLCADDCGHEVNSFAGQPTGRSVPAASVHSGWQSGIQHLSLDAVRRQTRRPHPARGLNQLHDLVWRHRKLGPILEQYGEDVRRSVVRRAFMNWCEDPYWTKGQYLSVLDVL